ncbi:MAG TPA: hypothetical protein VGB07_17495, partial [Blastocatellia bacterium]
AGRQLSGFPEFFVRMNFLHFAVLMFVICLMVLIVVSLVTPAPAASKVAGLTFQTVREKISMNDAESASILAIPAEVETPAQRTINLVCAVGLVIIIIFLWIYFA